MAIVHKLWRRERRFVLWSFWVFALAWYACQGFTEYARSDWGRDHLCGAAFYGSLLEMKLLLNAGANPSRVGWEEHFTPLGETVRGGSVEAARLLLAWGADPNVPNDEGWGKTAIQTYSGDRGKQSEQQRQVIALLRKAGGR